VGTYDLASYLIVTPEGHILINTGLASSASMIRANVEALGFAMRDIKLLLATHAHWDHVAALAELQRLTGGQVLMHEGDVPLLESGGNTDYLFGGNGPMFEPVNVDRALRDQSVVALGGVEITVHNHPGHTRGASSFTFTTRDERRSYEVLILNAGTVNDGTRLVTNPSYPGIAEDYARTFASRGSSDPTSF
jgi:metallo-beta-lactamase class B